MFNVAQIEGLGQDYYKAAPPPEDIYGTAVDLMKGYGVPVVYGGDRAFYSPNRDTITLPPYASFHSDDAFFGVLYHEGIHSTAHKDRLNRELGKKFGDPQYKFEELVAELGSAFLCARVGYSATNRNAAYIDSWIKGMEDDEKAIFRAASYASQAADYMWEAAFYAENEETPDVERTQTLGIAAE